jgi:Ribonuclease G/E
MAKEICISSTPHETRLAILEDDQLAEIYYERENEYTLAGSIYNGRVTRVLPGMQSAFVDIGLERDAFLYVTDFMELEDAEETDEIEKAAASGANQPPREVRHAAPEARTEGRNGRSGQKSEPKPEQKSEPKTETKQAQRPPSEKTRVLAVEEIPEPEAEPLPASGSISFSEKADGSDQDSGEPGAKRWRGRRRRRGGRGSASNEEQTQSTETPEFQVEEIDEAEQEVAPQIHAGASDRPAPQKRETADPTPHFDRAPASTPVPFVMPGESLSKYGGAPAEGAQPSAQPAASARPASSFKPATMIESPLQWDGSGLLPGESLSKHRNRPSEPVALEEPAVEQPEVEENSEPNQEILEKDLVSKWTKASQAEDDLVIEEPLDEDEFQEDEFEETTETSTEPIQAESSEETIEAAEPDADASHNLDPLPPSGFRLFGFGKKTEEEAKPATKPASSYAPGKGLIEEEVIEEEEYDAPRHLPIISDLLKPGQEILVQIAKEPIAKKGARITSHIALPGRFLVFMPTVNHIGVSRKIASDEERQRLKRILLHERGEASGGFIVRTAAEGARKKSCAPTCASCSTCGPTSSSAPTNPRSRPR